MEVKGSSDGRAKSGPSWRDVFGCHRVTHEGLHVQHLPELADVRFEQRLAALFEREHIRIDALAIQREAALVGESVIGECIGTGSRWRRKQQGF